MVKTPVDEATSFTVLEEGRKLLKDDGKGDKRSSRQIKHHLNQLKVLLEDENTGPALQHAILSDIPSFFLPLAQYPTLRQSIIKAVVKIWSGSPEEQLRLASTLVLHKLTLKHPKINRLIVKLMYRAFSKASASSITSGERSIATVSLLINGFIEVVVVAKPAVLFEYVAKICKENAGSLERTTKTSRVGEKASKEVSPIGPAFLVRLICLGRMLARAPSTIPSELKPFEMEAKSLFSRLIYCCISSQVSSRSLIFFLHTLTVAVESGVYRGQISGVLNSLLLILQKCSLDSGKRGRVHSTKSYVLASLFKASESDLQTDSFNNFVAEEVLYILTKFLVGMQGTCIFANLSQTAVLSIKALLTSNCHLKSKNLYRIMLGKLENDCKKLRNLTSESPLTVYAEKLHERDLAREPSYSLELPPFLANLENIRSKRVPMIYEEEEEPMAKANGAKAKKSMDERASNNKRKSLQSHQKAKRPLAEEDEEDDILEDFTP